MKGVVLSIPNAGIKKTDVTYYLKRYGVLIFLGLALVIGMVFGSLSAGQADEQMVKSLDFLFITNFKARLEQTLFLTFAASLTSCLLYTSIRRSPQSIRRALLPQFQREQRSLRRKPPMAAVRRLPAL